MIRLGILSICIFLLSCQTAIEKYNKQIEEGISGSQRVDSIFLGLHFGMSKKEFYAHCWKLNQNGILRQGPSNLSVEYSLDTSLNFPAYLRFYPQFHNDSIYRMPCEISYATVDPTNENLMADKLLTEVKNLLEMWYGSKFLYLENDRGEGVYVKVDGNRRIRIFRKDLLTVAVDITDMPVYLDLNEKNGNE